MRDSELVEVEGLKLRVSRRGSGPPLLLLNGIGANLDLFEPLRECLSGRETIAIDAPGTGGSDTPLYPIRLRRIARIVVGLLDRLGYEQVDVLGVSWGGTLAQELAFRHPERVRQLVLCATACGWTSVPGDLRTLRVLATPRRYFSPTYFREIAPILYGGAIREDPDLLRRQGHLRLLRPPSIRGYFWQMAALRGWTSLPWLHRLPHPTLVLAGGDDPLVPPVNARLLARRIPDATLHVLPSGGHLFVLTHPEEVGRRILRFLDGGASDTQQNRSRETLAAE